MSKASRRASNVAAIVAAAVSVPVTETVVGTVVPKSIRQLVMGEITKGTPTKEIAVLINRYFPGTAAATKSTKHIAWYRSRMKKDAKTAASAAVILGTVAESTAS